MAQEVLGNVAARGLGFLCPRSPVPWLGCLLSRVAACQLPSPAVRSTCLAPLVDAAQRARLWAGGQSGTRPPASFSSIRAGTAYMWSAGPRPPALALALTSACAAAGFSALPRQKEELDWWQDPGQWGPNGCRCEENAGLSHLAAGLSLGTEGSPWASCLCLPWREEAPAVLVISVGSRGLADTGRG